MKIALYVRISTNGEKQELDNQLQPLKAWAARLGDASPLIYSDEASGSKADRNGLKRLLEDAHKREFDTVLIWALDRLSREGIARMAGYLESLRSYGVRVLSHQEPWLDTAGPVSDLLIAIFGWVAQQERARIQERVKAGLRTAKAKGKKLGRPKGTYGTSLDLDRARAMKSEGLTTREIAYRLGVSKSLVALHLKELSKNNPTHSGVRQP